MTLYLLARPVLADVVLAVDLGPARALAVLVERAQLGDVVGDLRNDRIARNREIIKGNSSWKSVDSLKPEPRLYSVGQNTVGPGVGLGVTEGRL